MGSGRPFLIALKIIIQDNDCKYSKKYRIHYIYFQFKYMTVKMRLLTLLYLFNLGINLLFEFHDFLLSIFIKYDILKRTHSTSIVYLT